MSENKQIFISDYLVLIKKSIKKALFISLGFAALIAVYSFIMPKTYTSDATILPPKESSGGGGLSGFLQNMVGGAGSLVLGGGGGGASQSKIYGDILTSRSSAEYISKKLNLENTTFFDMPTYNDHIELVRSALEVEFERSGLMVISAKIKTGYFSDKAVSDSAAILSQEVSNTAIEALDYLLRMKNNSAAKKTRIYIQNELHKYYHTLDSVARVLEDYQKENKIIAIEEQTQAVVNQAIEIGAELSKAKAELALMQFQYEEKSPRVESLKKQVDFYEEEFRKVQFGEMGKVNQFSIALNELPRVAREYTELMRDREIYEKVIIYLETQKHQEAMQEEKDTPNIEILDNAIKPKTHSAPNRKLMVILSFTLAFLASIMVLIIREASSDKTV